MRVWVPIELPDGYQVDHVALRGFKSGKLPPLTIIPTGPSCPDPDHRVETPPDHFEYAVMLRNQQTEGSFMLDAKTMTDAGWRLILTCAITTAGVEFWFERRVA